MSALKYWMDESRESDPLNSKLLFNRVYEDCNGSPTADANRAFYAVPVEEYDASKEAANHIADGSKLVVAETPEEAARKWSKSGLGGVASDSFLAGVEWAKNNLAAIVNWEKEK